MLISVFCCSPIHCVPDRAFLNKESKLKVRLHEALQKTQSPGITLSRKTCEFSRNSLGHVINHDGVTPDPQKTSVILAMHGESQHLYRTVRRFMGSLGTLLPKSQKSCNHYESYLAPGGPSYGAHLRTKRSRR